MASNNQAKVKVCRVCLAMDVKMYEMVNHKISEMFQDVTGISACDTTESILHLICWECAARLAAAAAFRNKALLSDALLKNLADVNQSDIALLKEKHSSLKSPLTIKTTSSSLDIDAEQTICQSKEIEVLINVETEAVDRKTKIRMTEQNKAVGFEEYEPWINVPIKTEIESDPIGENGFSIEASKSHTPHFDMFSPREDSLQYAHTEDSLQFVPTEDEVRNTNAQIIMKSNIKRENIKVTNEPTINEGGRINVRDSKSMLNFAGNMGNETSSEEDKRSTAEEAPDIKPKKKMRVIRMNEKMKQKIIELKQSGVPGCEITKETGMSRASIDCWWYRYRKSCNLNRRLGYRKDMKYVQHNYRNAQPEPGKEMEDCPPVVRQRLYEAGLEHILMKKPERAVIKEKIAVSESQALHDDLKQRIITLKQEGIGNNRIAYLLNTTRITVRKWWSRWCEEGHMNNYKKGGRKRKTTSEEDQLLIDRVTQEQAVHTPSLAKELGVSPESVRRRLKAAGFMHKERTAYKPLGLGRHGVDEGLKQHIITLKLNGVSVTDISNEFRVPRTTIYQWWKRWCKENNFHSPNKKNKNKSTQEQGYGEDANVDGMPQITSSQRTLWQKSTDVKVDPYQELGLNDGDCQAATPSLE